MPTTYLSPGVYVEDVPPVARPIAGVGTSTAGFIGIIPDNLKYTVTNVLVGRGAPDRKSFPLENAYPVATTAETFEVRVDGEAVPDATLKNDDVSKTSSVEFTSPRAANAEIRADYQRSFAVVTAGEAKLCTTFSEFTNFFGGFGSDEGQNMLAQAVYGFFNNGGSRCYVARESKPEDIKTKSLVAFEAIDEIAIVAAPGEWKVRATTWQTIADDWETGSPSSIAERRTKLRDSIPYRRITPMRLSTSHGLRSCTRPPGKISWSHRAAT